MEKNNNMETGDRQQQKAADSSCDKRKVTSNAKKAEKVQQRNQEPAEA